MSTPQFLLNELEGRNGLAKLIVMECEEAGTTVKTHRDNDDITLEVAGAGLSATVKIWKGMTGPLTIGWHSARAPLQAVENAFHAANIDRRNGTTAITPCDSQAHLIEMLIVGLAAAKSGEAFY